MNVIESTAVRCWVNEQAASRRRAIDGIRVEAGADREAIQIALRWSGLSVGGEQEIVIRGDAYYAVWRLPSGQRVALRCERKLGKRQQ